MKQTAIAVAKTAIDACLSLMGHAVLREIWATNQRNSFLFTWVNRKLRKDFFNIGMLAVLLIVHPGAYGPVEILRWNKVWLYGKMMRLYGLSIVVFWNSMCRVLYYSATYNGCGIILFANPGRPSVKGVSLKPLVCRVGSFESHCGHGCLSLALLCG